MPHSGPWVGTLALVSGGIAVVILLYFLIWKPKLDLRVKVMLFAGLGIFPGISAGASTVAGMEQTTHREFCGSCHTMDTHFENATDPSQQSLAARHTRNAFFGKESCYVCHADYGMYGYAMTKLGGMRHVYLYYFGGYKQMTLEDSREHVHLMKPYDNTNCRQCHTTTARVWKRVSEHQSLEKELAENKISCASGGCHGYAHPFSKRENGHVAPAAASAAAPAGSP